MTRYEHQFFDREDGLSHCKVCDGAEGALPTLCPGRRLTQHEQDEIYAGRLNFATGPMCGAQWWVQAPDQPKDGDKRR